MACACFFYLLVPLPRSDHYVLCFRSSHDGCSLSMYLGPCPRRRQNLSAGNQTKEMAKTSIMSQFWHIDMPEKINTKETKNGKTMTKKMTANNPKDMNAMLASLSDGICAWYW